MSISAKNRIVFTVIALLAIVNLFFVPMISLFGGIIPDNSIKYFKVMDGFFSEPEAITYTIYNVPIILSVACLILLVTALTGNKTAHIIGSLIAIVLWFVPVVHCFIEGAGFEDLFSFKRGVFGIGMYVELLLFIVSLIVALASKSKASQRAYGPQGYAYQPPYQPYQPPYQQPQQGGYQPPYQAPYQPPYQEPAQPTYQPQYQPPYQPPYQEPAQPAYREPEPPVPPVPPVFQEPVQPAPEFEAPAPEAPVPEFEAPAPEAPAPEVAKFCPVCGAPIEGDGPFCGNCGAKL